GNAYQNCSWPAFASPQAHVFPTQLSQPHGEPAEQKEERNFAERDKMAHVAIEKRCNDGQLKYEKPVAPGFGAIRRRLSAVHRILYESDWAKDSGRTAFLRGGWLEFVGPVRPLDIEVKNWRD